MVPLKQRRRERMRLMTKRNAVFIAGLAVVATAAVSIDLPAVTAAAQEPFTIAVAPAQARVVFPLPALSEWEWCLPDTRDLGLEYQWTAEVSNNDAVYSFGVFLFKCLGSGATHGDFNALLRSGQIGVFESVPTGGRLIREAKVAAETTANQLHLVVKDARTLRLLFSERPPAATLRVQHPGEPLVARQVTIGYVE
jgi:hypothetical protein